MSNINRTRGATIEVTQELIDNATKSDSGRCMIADAIKATFPTFKSVLVDLQSIRFSDPKTQTRRVYWTTRQCQQALVDFDDDLDIEPFSFRLGTCIQEVPMNRRTRGIAAPVMRSPKETRNATPSTLPTKVGGRMPPQSVALSNQQRVRGVRSLKALSEARRQAALDNCSSNSDNSIE
jgi:hypothetical protein